MKKKLLILLLLLPLTGLAAFQLCRWLLVNNKNIETVTYDIVSDRLPSAFDGFRIAHISDLHNEEMGPQNADLLQLLQQAEPDIIAVTGDLLDCRTPDTAVALAFLEQALQIAPVYYVTGNHEGALFDIYPSFEAELVRMGVSVLHGETVLLTREGSTLCIAGTDDPNINENMENELQTLLGGQNKNSFTVLLSHRPELFEKYCSAQADLVLTGHAHGGQVRLPFLGGLYAPGQGILPTYDAGLFTQDSTHMIVSRGIGNSLFPLRVNNRPELPVAVLHCA